MPLGLPFPKTASEGPGVRAGLEPPKTASKGPGWRGATEGTVGAADTDGLGARSGRGIVPGSTGAAGGFDRDLSRKNSVIVAIPKKSLHRSEVGKKQ